MIEWSKPSQSHFVVSMRSSVYWLFNSTSRPIKPKFRNSFPFWAVVTVSMNRHMIVIS